MVRTLSSSDAGEFCMGGQITGRFRRFEPDSTHGLPWDASPHGKSPTIRSFLPVVCTGAQRWWRAPWAPEYERVLIGPSPAVLMPCSSPRARRPSCGIAPPRPTSPSPLRTPTSWLAWHASPKRAELSRRRGQARLVERPSAADRPRARAVPARRACRWVSASDRSPAPAGAFRRWVAAESSYGRRMQPACRIYRPPMPWD